MKKLLTAMIVATAIVQMTAVTDAADVSNVKVPEVEKINSMHYVTLDAETLETEE